MANEAQARIVIKGDANDAIKSLKKVKEAVGELDKQVSSKKGLFKDFLGGFGLAQLSAAGVAAGIGLFVKASLSAASELEALEGRSRAIYGDAFPRMSVQAEELAATLHRSSSDIMGMQTELSTLYTGVGIAGRAMEEMSGQLTELAVDFASFRHISDEDAFRLIESGIRGQTRALQQYNIVMSDAALQNFATARGYKTLVKDMNDAQLVELRSKFIIDKLSDAQGNAAKNAGTYANRIKSLSSEWKDFQEIVGKPIGGAAAAGLHLVSGALKAYVVQVTLAKNAFIGLANLISKPIFGAGFKTDYRGPALKALGDRNLSFEDFKAAQEAAAELEKSTKRILSGDGDSGGGGENKAADAFKKMQEAMEDLGRTYANTRRDIDRELNGIETAHIEKMNSIQDALDRVTKSVQDLDEAYVRTMRNLGQDDVEAVVKQQERVAELKQKILDKENQAIIENYRGSISLKTNDDLAELRKKLEKEQKVLDDYQETHSGTVATATAEGAKSEFERDIERINQRREDENVDRLKRLQDLAEERGKIVEKRTDEKLAYAALRQEYASTTVALDAYYQDYVLKMSDLKTVTEETAKAMKQALEDIRNSISKVDAETASSSELGKRVQQRREARQIPAMAEGGIVTRPTLALIGERGPEAVVPLGKGSGMGVTIGAIHVHNEADEDRLIAKLARLIQLRQLAA